jgi:hypothetical protein
MTIDHTGLLIAICGWLASYLSIRQSSLVLAATAPSSFRAHASSSSTS